MNRFFVQWIRSAVLVAVLVSLSACGTASLYKESTKAFGEQTVSALDATGKFVDAYEYAGLWDKANAVTVAHMQSATSVADLVNFDHDSKKEIAFVRLTLKSLTDYSKALEQLTNLGSAKTTGSSLRSLGSSLENSGTANAAAFGAIANTLAEYLINRKIGESVKKTVLEADPMVQEFGRFLETTVSDFSFAIISGHRTRSTILRSTLQAKTQGPRGKQDELFEVNEMLLGIRKSHSILSQTQDATDNAVEALQKMRAAHTKLKDTATKSDQEGLINAIIEFEGVVQKLTESIEKL